ncbi:MAG: PQQ-binding-like beta-propeller repeat protein [Paracoccaceae bacterium]
MFRTQGVKQATKRPAWMLMAAAAAVVTLASCEREVILPGDREDIRDATVAERQFENQSPAISLSGQTANTSWAQGPGSPTYRTTHPALSSAPQRFWSANIGLGNTRKQRITAEPIIGGGLIYTLDASARVSAFANNGGTVWSTDLTPVLEDDGDATGGGMAYYQDRLYVSSGFGNLTALNAKTGAVLWKQKLDATGSGQPTIVDGLLYVMAGDNTGWVINIKDGTIAWQVTASPSLANVLGAPPPAISGKYAVFGFGSGDVLTVFRRGGLRRWEASVAGQRVGRTAAQVTDVTGPPMIVGSRVYVGNHSGRTAAFDMETGDRLWTASQGALGNIWPAGNSLFVVTDRQQLARISTSDGSLIWAVDLPGFKKDKPRRRGPVYAHYGPVVAGGRVFVASSDGVLRAFNPQNGALTHQTALPGGAASQPVVANRTLYVVSQEGQLHAFR